MEWALESGQWEQKRFEAIDADNHNQLFLSIPIPWQSGSTLPGLRRAEEPNPWRITTRKELACLASWQRILIKAEQLNKSWVLLIEDDIGSSLAVPASWPISLDELIDRTPQNALAIQMAPISSSARVELYKMWINSGHREWLVPKKLIRSNGNGAILLKDAAYKRLISSISRIAEKLASNFHPIAHPWAIRPVADKWLFGLLPKDSCYVSSYPLFCLDAKDSSLHPEHVNSFHLPSKEITLKIWEEDARKELIDAQNYWDRLSQNFPTEKSIDFE